MNATNLIGLVLGALLLALLVLALVLPEKF